MCEKVNEMSNEANNASESKAEHKKTLKDYIPLLSFGIAGVAFILRGMWYFYHCGYFDEFCIDKCYLIVDSDSSIYSILGLNKKQTFEL